MLAVVRDPTESRLTNGGEDTPGETLVKIVTPGKSWRTGGRSYFSLNKTGTPGEKSTNRWCKPEKVMGGGETLPRRKTPTITVDRHEPSHRIALNKGVVIKRNANQRYATDATSEAFIVEVCRNVEVPLQYYIHRNDLPCGSTIGPITAAQLAVPTVDIETAGLADVVHLEAALHAVWRHRANLRALLLIVWFL